MRLSSEQGRKPVDGKTVALDPEPAEHGLGDRGDVGVTAKFLARMNVADVDLDDRQFRRDDGVKDRNGRVSEGAGVDDHATRVVACFLQPIDDIALVV